ncbi:MAG TPA: hypothetical protein VJP85_01105 [Candidatus Baltobacteraceae bacterium]|nr:hypothetical protein [Candidatus Baltobacteraceae bacterium]
MINQESTLADVAFAVAGALEARGISSVLTGGSAAALYAPQAYMSDDADFVLERDEPLSEVAAALQQIGFTRDGKSRIFFHPNSRFTIDFPKGPLAVGGDYVRQTDTLVRDGRRLRILTRLDCVRDRLAHFYHWTDYTALNAALAVAARFDEHDLQKLLEWTQRESPELVPKFEEFVLRLRARRARKK